MEDYHLSNVYFILFSLLLSKFWHIHVSLTSELRSNH